MKKKYLSPELEIEHFTVMNILTASGSEEIPDNGDGWNEEF